ncbi:MAPEG family protein [Thermomonas aquatica]|uniref:MAPEG family protein n=1 Tax=Thermomonas aquatica TaxID=2202149 RepID=A0A5B7ZU35_9GAMM|nr:MAPEG family protein [Thermomonas aquatica]QDA58036.1 MAPEG family protein [Thermomonas aquatica]
MPKITLLFAALHALLLLALAVPIARYRHAHKIGLGDGGDKLLARRIRVHGNFIEHVPLALLLLAMLELCGLPAVGVWSFGSVLLLGRLLHAAGLSRHGGYSFGRFWGTSLTWLSLLLMALAGLWLALR